MEIRRIISLSLLLGLAMRTTADVQNCGKPLSMNSRIYGGNATCLGCIPWQVAIWDVESDDQGCGGTIVSSRYVVTAAHCAEYYTERGLKVKAGMVDYYDEDATEHEIEKIYIHPKRDRAIFDYDYAILELKDPIDIEGDSKSRAACLPEKDDTEFNENTVFRTSGWGDGSERPNLLMDVVVPWCSDKMCWKSLEKLGHKITTRMVCAGHRPEQVYDRVCHRDSGGGLIWKDPHTGLSKLVGITSWGMPACTKGYPAVYARVTTVLDWIKEITNL